jgi:hypothetical protein
VHAKELEFLGFGFPLWFTFLKYCAILVLMLIVSESFVSVYKAIQNNKEFCSDEFNRYQHVSPLHRMGLLEGLKHDLPANQSRL